MKKNLIEKLLDLFDQKLTTNSSSTTPSTEDPDEPSWGDITQLENNTLFVKESRPASKRVLCLQEATKLSYQSFKFLEQLIHLNVIGEKTFELIMNQILFSESLFVSLQETKWIVHETLASSLDETQLAFLDLILYQQEDRLTAH